MPLYVHLRKAFPDNDPREAVRRRTIEGIRKLRAALKAHFPADADRLHTLRIGTWNIREFGNTKYGGRDTYEPLYYMAEIISNFDIAALQEVREDMNEFLELKHILGRDWDFIATDVTDGGAGNGERMVFLYNTNRARFSKIAGELTLPDGKKVLAAFGERIRLHDGVKLKLPPGSDLSGVYEASSAKSGNAIKLAEDVEIELPAGALLELPDHSALAVIKGTVVTRPAGTSGKVEIAVPAGEVEGELFGVRFPGEVLDDSLKQFARTPFVVAFQSDWLKVDLCTVHIYYGDDIDPNLLAQRKREIERLTEALGDRAAMVAKKNPNNPVLTAVMGDFNIVSREHETMKALESSGFEVPDQIKEIPAGSNVERDKAYDQIAFWKPKEPRGYVTAEFLAAGIFDYYEQVYTDAQQAQYRTPALDGQHPGQMRASDNYSTWRTFKMSDHLPMWLELKADFSDAYIEACAKAKAD